jgi:hypothetical protein
VDYQSALGAEYQVEVKVQLSTTVQTFWHSMHSPNDLRKTFSSKIRLLQLAAVTENEGAPVLQLAHAALRGNLESVVRTAVTDLVDVSEMLGDVDALGRSQRRLALHAATPCLLAPCVPHMASLQVHEHASLHSSAHLHLYSLLFRCPSQKICQYFSFYALSFTVY